MTAPLTISLEADTSSFLAAIDELSQALPDLADRFPECLLRFDALLDAGAMFALDGDCLPTSGTNPLVMHLKPSEGFLRLLATVRAGDFNANSLDDCFGQFSAPLVRFAATNVRSESGDAQALPDSIHTDAQEGIN